MTLSSFRPLTCRHWKPRLRRRRAQAVDRAGIVPIILDDVALLARKTTRFLGDRAIDLVLRHGETVLAADFGKDQAKPNPALGDALIFRLHRCLILRRLGLLGS